MKKSIVQITTVVREMRAEHMKNTDELNAIVESLKALEKDSTRQKVINEKMITKLIEVDQAASRLNAQIQIVQRRHLADMQDIRVRVSRIDVKIVEISSKVTSNKEEIDALKLQLKRLKTRMDSEPSTLLKNVIETVQVKIVESTEKLISETVTKEFVHTEKSIEKLETSIKIMEKDMEKEKVMREKSEMRVTELNKQLEVLTDSVTILQKEDAKSTRELKELIQETQRELSQEASARKKTEKELEVMK